MEWLVLEFILRSGLIVLTAATVLRVLGIRAAAAQHAVWVGVLVVMLLLPLWILWGPKAALAVLPARDASPKVMTAPSTSADPAATVAMPVEPSELSSESPIRSSSAILLNWNWSWNMIGLAAYLLGVVALLWRLAIGTFRANRLTSASCAAPVTVGLLHPRVILPDCFTEWPQPQLDAVLAHENAHVRRRDPLVLWLALLNRALFWFHPLAWWLERRITALAEEACDAAVIERGHDPHDYSDYLLDVARAVQRAGARVNVTAMAMPGSYLAPRIRKIIAGVSSSRVSRVRMAGAIFACAICSVMFAAGSLEHVARIQFPLSVLPQMHAPVYKISPEAISAPAKPSKNTDRVLIAQATPTPQTVPQPVVAAQSVAAPMPQFEVASIKLCGNGDAGGGGARGGRGGGDGQGPSPDRLNLACQPLMLLIRMAYLNFAGGHLNRRDTTPVDGGPAWVTSERYQITAKSEGNPGQEVMRGPMLQALLEDRFKLKIRRESREVPAYALTAGKGVPKLKPFQEGSCVNVEFGRLPGPGPDGNLPALCNFRSMRRGLNDAQSTWEVKGASLDEFARSLGDDMDRIVINKTGIAGKFDFHIEFIADESMPSVMNALRQRAAQNGEPAIVAADPSGGLSIFTAIQQQLGIKLEPSKGPRDFLVIDRVEKPTEN
jgi:bla regulator protein blaR1